MHLTELPNALAPSELPRWAGDPAGCPGGDWRPQNHQAAQVGISALAVAFIFGDPTPSEKKYR